MAIIDKNTMLEKLKRGEVVIGTQIRSRSTSAAEIAAMVGFDFAYIETEHFLHNEETIENLIRAIKCCGGIPVVRIPTKDVEQITRMIEAGPMGVILPHVENGEEARAIVDACKFPPLGKRSGSLMTRNGSFNAISDPEFKKNYMTFSNENVAVHLMVESRNAIEHLDEILDAKPDVLRVGRSDLKADIGAKDYHDPIFINLARKVIDKAAERGIPTGVAAGSIQDVIECVELGFRQICFSSDLNMMVNGWTRELATIRKNLGK